MAILDTQGREPWQKRPGHIARVLSRLFLSVCLGSLSLSARKFKNLPPVIKPSLYRSICCSVTFPSVTCVYNEVHEAGVGLKCGRKVGFRLLDNRLAQATRCACKGVHQRAHGFFIMRDQKHMLQRCCYRKHRALDRDWILVASENPEFHVVTNVVSICVCAQESGSSIWAGIWRWHTGRDCQARTISDYDPMRGRGRESGDEFGSLGRIW